MAIQEPLLGDFLALLAAPLMAWVSDLSLPCQKEFWQKESYFA